MRPLWCALGVLSAAGMVCSSVPQRQYFTLSYPMTEGRTTETRPPLHPVRLRLRPFTATLPYDRPQIVYRQSPYVFQYYAFKLWASKPQHMLREIVERHILASRLVAEVEREYGERPPDYELGAEVVAIEEFDSGDVWYGHLAMRFELLRFRDKTVIWRGHFDRRRVVHKREPVYVVHALSQVLEEEMRRIVAELDHVLSGERGVQPTLPLVPPVREDASPPVPSDDAAIVPAEPRAPQAPPTPVPGEEDLIVPEEGGP